MPELNAEQLRDEARRYRMLAKKFDELASLLESNSGVSPALGDEHAEATFFDEKPRKKDRETKGEPWRKIITRLALAEGPVRPSEIVREEKDKDGGLHEQTIYAVLKRFNSDEVEKNGDGYVLKNYSWVFSYGINMREDHLKVEFKRKGFEYDKVIVTKRPGVLQRAKLSWRNRSLNWAGGTATFDEDMDSELWGVAYLVDKEGLRAFDEQERPRYVRGEKRHPINLDDGITIHAWVYNVAPDEREPEDVPPPTAYVQQMLLAAKSLHFPQEYVAIIESKVGFKR